MIWQSKADFERYTGGDVLGPPYITKLTNYERVRPTSWGRPVDCRASAYYVGSDDEYEVWYSLRQQLLIHASEKVEP